MLRRLVGDVSLDMISESKDFRMRAAETAANAFGVERVIAESTLVNLGALAMSLGDSPVVHEFEPEALELIDATDLRSLPAEAPSLLKSAFILAGRGGVDIMPGTAELGVYPCPGGFGFLGSNAGGMGFFLWHPRWGEREIAGPDEVLLDGTEVLESWARQALRFVLIYAAFLEAEKTPVLTENNRKKEKKSVRKRAPEEKRKQWTIRHISLTMRIVSAPREGSDPTGGGIEGRVAVPVRVSGHLVRQPYGPGRSLRKWIYVAEYGARRWIVPGARTFVVSK